MTIRVHIIDSSKPSLVMSSEVFKDKIPGSIVSFSLSGKEGLTCLQSKTGKDLPDALVVDFNLPDVDGVTLIKELRKFFAGPIFMTAAPDKIVDYAVGEELFHYHDACCWIPKPVRYEVLEKRIEQFLINRHRLGKRFDVNYPSRLVGKGEGRGKRAPKFDGKLMNISLGGVCVAISEAAKLKRDEEFVVTMAVPTGSLQGATAISVLKPLLTPKKVAPASPIAKKVANKDAKPDSKLSKKLAMKMTATQKSKQASNVKSNLDTANARRGATGKVEVEANATETMNYSAQNMQEYKVKASVAWVADGGRKIGLKFAKMPDSQRKQIETFLKSLSV